MELRRKVRPEMKVLCRSKGKLSHPNAYLAAFLTLLSQVAAKDTLLSVKPSPTAVVGNPGCHACQVQTNIELHPSWVICDISQNWDACVSRHASVISP